MTNWLKYAAVTMLVFVVFAAGYQLASARGDAALKSYQLEAAVARAEQGKKDYAKLVSAVDQVVAADVDIERIRSDTDRMRRAYEPENRGIYTQSDSPKKSSRNIWSLAVVSVDQRY